VVDSVERIIRGGVAITARALGEDVDDLTFAQWRVLTLVGEPSPGIHVRGVGQRVGVSAPSASRLLRRLEDRGLIELHRRYMRVRLTPSGEAARTKVIERRRVAVREMLRASSEELPDDVPGALSAIADTLLVSA
jgi:DNA-binding MarR family transcriptional regulator